jgi:hypothetical protein
MLSNGPGPRLIDLGNPVADHPLNRGLVAWWLGLPNNSGGSRLFDLTGRYSPGTLTNGPTWAPGPDAAFRALSFDGTDDTAAFPLTASFPRTAGTVFLRARSTTASGIRQMFMWRVDGSNEIGLVDFNGTFGLNLACQYNAGGTNKNVGYATSLTTNEWASLAVVWDAGAASVLRLYLNGREVGTAATGLGTMSGSNPLFYHIGGANGSDYFLGQIESTLLWERALSAGEVAALCDQSRRGYPDLLRRYTPRTWYFGAQAGGGGTTENLTPVAATASVVAVTSSLSQALSPVSATAAVAAPAQSLSHAVSPVSCTAGVVGVATSLSYAADAVVATAGVVTPATSLAHALSATSSTASVVAPDQSLSQAASPVTTTGTVTAVESSLSASPDPVAATATVPAVTAQTEGSESPAPVTCTGSVAAVATALAQAASPVVATGSVPEVTAVQGTLETPSPVTCTGSVASAATALSQALAACLATATVVAVTASVPSAPTATGRRAAVTGRATAGGSVTGRGSAGFAIDADDGGND